MIRPKKIDFIVSSNGYGHLKRVLNVCYNLLDRSVIVTVHCSKNHFQFASKNFRGPGFDVLNFDSTSCKFELPWLSEKSYTLKDYREWEKSLRQNISLQEADLIVSDNQILPAKVYSKTILMGSFLWPWALDYNDCTKQKIAQEEKEWLAGNKPRLIGVSDMINVDELENYVQIIGMPWFSDRVKSPKPSGKTRKLLVSGGGTGKLTEALIQLIRIILSKEESIILYLDEKLYSKCVEYNMKGIYLFDFKDKSFQELSAVICRPGIGILTDCIRFSIPIIAITDNDNKEILYNAVHISDLGLGFYINIEEDENDVVYTKINDGINNSERMHNFRIKSRDRDTGGAKIVADYLLSQIYE